MRERFKSLLIFLSGASFFHLISHLILPWYMDLPLVTRFGLFTSSANVLTIVISALVTAALFWGAWKLSCAPHNSNKSS